MLIYFGNNHFTARLIDRSCNVWYYDSTANDGRCKEEKKFTDFNTAELAECNMGVATCILYAKNM